MADYNLTLSGLTKYVNENSGILLKETIDIGNSFDYISVQTGIKNSDSLNLYDLSLTGVASAGCSEISATGSAALTQRNLTVCPITFAPPCVSIVDFEQYWMGQLAREGSYNEEIPTSINEVFSAALVQELASEVEKLFWLGSTDGTFGSGNLLLCDGVLDILENTSATMSITTVTASGALTVDTAIDVVDQMIDSIPAALLADETLTLFMSKANFLVLMRALRDKNYYADYNTDKAVWVLDRYTNAPITILGVTGLVGRNEMILTPAKNIYLGTDSYGELKNGDGIQMWYDLQKDGIYTRVKIKIGAQIARPAYVVYKAS